MVDGLSLTFFVKIRTIARQRDISIGRQNVIHCPRDAVSSAAGVEYDGKFWDDDAVFQGAGWVN
jgi:hypothetical protein